MSDTLYIQTDKNMKVTKEIVTLGEIADLSCKNSSVLARNQVRKIAILPKGNYGRYVVSMIDVIREIEKAEPQVEICHIGEPTFVLTYEVTYSIGIGVGVVLFFNHFGRRKLTQDPTPMEVEMRTYEDDVDTTIIEQADRSQKGDSHGSS